MEVSPEKKIREWLVLSYAVVRMAKMKSHDLKGIQFHNQRERESKTNPDIDAARTEDNYDLINSTMIDYNKRVKEIIETQKETDRKTRKDAVLVNEFIVTSDREFFDGLTFEETKVFFEQSVDFFSKRYGVENVAYATVHMDEKTPHMHLGIVPMKEGRLQGKNVFNRKELLAIQELYPKHMQSCGFDLERGEKGSDREHIETMKFKKMALEKEIAELKKERDARLKEKIDVLKEIPNESFKVQVKGYEIKTVVNQKVFGQSDVTRSNTGNLIIRPKEVERIEKTVKAALAVKEDYENLLQTDLVSRNKELEKRNYMYFKEKRRMTAENNRLKERIELLRGEVQKIYKHTEEFFKSVTRDENGFKNIFKGWIDKMPSGEFGEKFKNQLEEFKVVKGIKRDRDRDFDR